MSLTKEKTLELLWQRMAERGDFPSLQRSVTGIVSAMQSENTSTADLASSVLSDFALTQKVIRLANSAMYAPFGCNVTTVSRAIMILGVDTIGHLALSLKLLEGFGEVAAGRDDMARELARATLAGAFARDITSKNGIRDGEEAVVCTLLHHVARLLVTYCFPDEWVEIQRLAEQQGISDSEPANRCWPSRSRNCPKRRPASGGCPSRSRPACGRSTWKAMRRSRTPTGCARWPTCPTKW